MSKILILTSSPQRDKQIDELLKKELESLGNEVFVRSVPINAREEILELKPDILVTPPIRNFFAYNLTETAARFGIAVALRHIEPSCDESDIEIMPDHWRKQLLIQRPKDIKLELVWSSIEIDYVKTFCDLTHKMVPVGAFVADIYKVSPEKDSKFCEKYELDCNRQTILISSPWGLSDSDSDRLGSSTHILLNDTAARDKWVEMVKELQAEIGENYNILATLHPGILKPGCYKEAMDALNIPIDVESTAAYLLTNCDYLVHSGSTMAIEMHWLNKPAFQFGDVNSIEMPDKNWWHQKDSPISKVSPFFITGKEIAEAIKKSSHTSNANAEAIKKLEEGRYGSMDGNSRIFNLVELCPEEATCPS